jgi:hypothetical protein
VKRSHLPIARVLKVARAAKLIEFGDREKRAGCKSDAFTFRLSAMD